MPKKSSCRLSKSYCRKLSPGKKARAGKQCSKSTGIRGRTVSGTRVAAHFRPKDCGITRIQAAMRGRLSRKNSRKSSSTKRKSTSPSRPPSSRAKLPRLRLIEEM